MKKNSSQFAKIFIPLVVILLGIIISMTVIMNYYGYTMDTYYGKGQMNILNPEGTENWDTSYYTKMFDSAEGENGSLAYATAVTKSITDEGIILMKNNGVLPLAKNCKITPVGCRYLYPVYGGIGSGSVKAQKVNTRTPEQSISEHFGINTVIVQKMKSASPLEMSETTTKYASVATDGNSFTGARSSLYEFEPEIYDGTEASCLDTVGLIFIGRVAGEGESLQTTGYADGTPHALALTESEKAAVAFAKKNCTGIVAVINSSNVMEIGELMSGRYECDAIVWVGGPGSTGFWSLGDILAGDVNPSGRTADIWSTDLLLNPAQANFDDIRYSNSQGIEIASNYAGDDAGLYFVEYEEGIYVGYRYYETASDLGHMTYGSINKNGMLLTKGAVNYPFGYGLSYSMFTQKIKNISESATAITLTVEITNLSDVSGKEVIQVYYTPPYTEFDSENNVEKATKNLIVFKKVEVEARQTEQVTIIFNKEDMASYCFTRKNNDGTTGSYFLEKGNYILTLGKNSHVRWDSVAIPVENTIWYDETNIRQSEKLAQTQLDDSGKPLNFPKKAVADTEATYRGAYNQFEDVTGYMFESNVTVLKRSDWNGTQPVKPEPKELNGQRLKNATVYDPFTDPFTGNVQTSVVYNSHVPVQKADNNLKLSDLRGKDYYDGMWESLLDQLDLAADDLMNVLLYSSFRTGKIEAIDKPISSDSDGPQGWRRSTGGFGNAYCTEVVVASTFNTALAYKYGGSIGQEALTFGINGWYGPGLNIHRSPFSGRNYEYYSEDPLLSGKMAAGCISGAADRGVLSYVKHFALTNNDGPITCLAVWATEQTIREIYLRSFEIAFKEARMAIKYIADGEGSIKTKIMRGATGVMAAANMIGTDWCAANYNLLENVLRGEWGFQGAVTTDMALQNSPGITDKIFRAGSDLRMAYYRITLIDQNSPTALAGFRRAIKNVAYAYVNSNLMQGLAPGAIVYYDMSPWAIGLLAANITVYSLIISLYASLIVLRLKERKKAV